MNKQEKIFEQLFKFVTLTSIGFLGLIAFFLLYKGLKPFIFSDINLWNFILGTTWNPGTEIYGVGYMIVSTLLSTTGAIILAVPIGILTSVLISEFMPKSVATIVIFAVDLLSGIPSVLYGLFGLGIIVPYISKISPNPEGQSLLAVIIVLSIMILPTIISITVSSIKAVPDYFREASLALGADRIQTSFKVVVPAAKSGILASVVLAIGRAIGETMAVILVAGNVSGGLPSSIFDKIRPLTSNIALEMSYAEGVHRELLFSTGLLLFIIVMILNIIMTKIIKKKESK